MNPLSLSLDSLPILIDRLTPRQMEIVSLLAEGKSARDIAAILSITLDMVKQHVYRARNRLGLDNRIQLIVVFVMWKMRNDETGTNRGN